MTYQQTHVHTSTPGSCSVETRQKLVKKQCEHLGLNRSLDVSKRHLFHHIVTDDKHRLLYCFVPKAACTTWKTIFANYTDAIQAKRARGELKGNRLGVNVHDAEDMAAIGLPVLSSPNFRSRDISQRLATYTKMVIVRHPFDRLLSAYREKFQKQFYKLPIIRYVAQHYANIHNTSRAYLKPGMIPFSSFIHFLVNDYRQVWDEHWSTFNDLCHPCLIHYDVIAKVETMPRDASHILASLTGSDVNTPSIHRRNSFVDAHTTLDMFKSLPEEMVKSLRNIYEIDFRMFGYEWNMPEGEAICKTSAEGNDCC